MLIEQNNNLCPTLRANHDEKTCNPPCICTEKSRFGLHIKKMLMISVEHYYITNVTIDYLPSKDFDTINTL